MKSIRRFGWLLLVLPLAGWWYASRVPVSAPPEFERTAIDAEVLAALTAARQQVIDAPRSVAAWGHYGMVLRAHDFPDACVEAFQQAERLDPRDARWPYLAGLTLVQRDVPTGLVYLRRACDRLGDKPNAPRFRLVELLMENGELADAERVLQAAQKREPQHPRGRLLAARLAAARQDWPAVLALPLSTLDDPHTARQAHQLLADAAQQQGDAPRAAEMLRLAQQLPADQLWPDPFVMEVEALLVGASARIARAVRSIREGRADEAVGQLQTIVRDHPDEISAWVLLGEAQRSLRRLDEAARALEEAVQRAPNSVDGWFQLGIVRSMQQRPEQAAQAFQQAVRHKPDHTLAQFNLGVMMKQLKQPDAARAAWQAALRSQPDYAPAQQALAELDRQR